LSTLEVFYSVDTYDVPIGLARDGHVIIGPYKADGTTFGCDDRDVCNGAFIDGQYVYVGSSTFPYVVGCWGPGPDPAFEPGCTNSGCGPTASDDSVPDDKSEDSTDSNSDSSSGISAAVGGAIASVTASLATITVAMTAVLM
jgi:hypothetical protein